jgi:hypothetical protein
LKLIFYILIKCAKSINFAKSKNLKFKRTEKIKVIRIAKSCGNISRKSLLQADGNNFRAELDTLQLLKLSEADFFFCSRVDVKKKTTYVTIKDYNKDRLAELIGADVSELGRKNKEVANQILYSELKKQAADTGVKLSYKIVGEAELEKLHNSKIKFAYFRKDDSKINICFLPNEAEKINRIIFADEQIVKPIEKAETEMQKNTRINNEIKTAAALSGEKPKYKVVTAEQLAIIKKTGVKFAAFKNGEKFNTVFLKSDESKILSAVKMAEVYFSKTT